MGGNFSGLTNELYICQRAPQCGVQEGSGPTRHEDDDAAIRAAGAREKGLMKLSEHPGAGNEMDHATAKEAWAQSRTNALGKETTRGTGKAFKEKKRQSVLSLSRSGTVGEEHVMSKKHPDLQKKKKKKNFKGRGS